jgi:predicted ATPase
MELGVRSFEPYHKALLGKAHLATGAAAVGLELLEDAIRFADESGLRYWDAELLRMKGEVIAHLAPAWRRHQEAEGCYREALAVARGQQARSLELRAATNLACLWREQGKRTEARDLLTPIYGWFTEGFDTLDLKEAKALLDELA